ncbi:MAG: sigma-70 family RNA polymerase sigma factor [Myxococcales bacterium]|nr:sigma-70 family RNA polymerase sigma factor [Myxococcales bacterium]
MQPDDREELAAWRAGDRGAGKALFERHYGAVARFFRNKAGDAWAELTQRTFLALLETLPRYRGDGTFRGYLFGIAYRQLLRHYRERARDRDRLDFGTVSAADLEPSPSAVVGEREHERVLLTCLRRLPLDYQVILELHYWEDMSARECGEALDLPLGTAKTRLRRGRQLLERELTAIASGQDALTRTSTRLDEWARALRARALPDTDGS